MLSIRVRNWCACWAYASGTDAYAQHTHQFLTRMLRVRISSWCICSAFFEGNALCARISTWCVCSVHASIPYAHAEGKQNEHLKNTKTDAHAEHACQELMRMLRVRISSWRARSGCASVPDPYAQRAHKGRRMRLRNSIFFIKHRKILKISVDAYKWSQKLLRKKFFFAQTQKKIHLKNTLSIRVRNFAPPNEPLIIV